MNLLYTWKDIEIIFESNRKSWPSSWKRVDVYSDEIVIQILLKENDRQEDKQYFNNLLANCFDYENYIIRTAYFNAELPVVYEEYEREPYDIAEKEVLPLFRDIYLHDSITNRKKHPEKPQIIAFHSYKGGVGRTLVLTSLLKEISELYGNRKKVLVIDSDLEAPGLTWAIEKSTQFSMSYWNFLSVLRVYGGEKDIIKKTAELMAQNIVSIETEEERVQHYFMPAYTDQSQLMASYTNPQNLLETAENRFLITEAVYMLAEELKADLVLVDLRAGISEISAPLLFDSRVQKYFVSSTSLQSIEGTRMIQEQVFSKAHMDVLNTKIALTMIPREMSADLKNSEIDRLVEIPEMLATEDKDSTWLRDEYVLEIPFESQLLYLGNFEDICKALTGSETGKRMRAAAKSLFENTSKGGRQDRRGRLDEKLVRERLKLLNDSTDVTAEASDASDMLLTDSIQEIIRGNQDEVPNIVILGAKGSGKTYLYKQLIYKRKWGEFVREFEKNKIVHRYQEALLVPVLATANGKTINRGIIPCLETAAAELQPDVVSVSSFEKIRKEIIDNLQVKKSSSEWAKLWEKLILSILSDRFSSLQEVNDYLNRKGKNIIFLFDGLDDLPNYINDHPENVQVAVQALCQNVIHEIDRINNRRIGMLVFLRRDIAEDSIKYNFQQFRDQYLRYELNWTQTEALRLALWLAGKAIPELLVDDNILLVSRERMEKRLELLWGKKLGKVDSKEANSARWIIAALSDFNGQLQARDIVRFLKNASGDAAGVILQYRDRYIMPNKIREAIEPCSKDKVKEIREEMPGIYEILKKFEEMDSNDKLLPLDLNKISLSVDELAKLEQQGYIKISDKKYYLPEIIRQSLGFRYSKGARPKVLSLLVK